MLWNKSKQMGSMAQVVWHDEEGGEMAAQKYTGQLSNCCAKAMCCNRGCKPANPSALWETNPGFWHILSCDYT